MAGRVVVLKVVAWGAVVMEVAERAAGATGVVLTEAEGKAVAGRVAEGKAVSRAVARAVAKVDASAVGALVVVGSVVVALGAAGSEQEAGQEVSVWAAWGEGREVVAPGEGGRGEAMAAAARGVRRMAGPYHWFQLTGSCVLPLKRSTLC